MAMLDENPGWVEIWGSVIVQIHPKELIPGVDYTNFSEYDRRDYGDTLLLFFERVSVE